MSKVINEIKRAREKKALTDEQYRTQVGRENVEHLKRVDAADEWRRDCANAKVKDYERWLTSYIEQGGRITHVYDYACPANTLIAGSLNGITPTFGAESRNVIVLAEYVPSKNDRGHANIYYYDAEGKARLDGHFVPLYSNMFKEQ
jgi:hypothetical protein